MFKHRALSPSVLFAMLLCSNTCFALSGSSQHSRAGTAAYIFIDNKIDREYLITTKNENPTFKGLNKWPKLSTPSYLGHIGFFGWGITHANTDLWIENAPVSRPILGLYCQLSAQNCTSIGTIRGENIDDKGIYKALSGENTAGGSSPVGTISPELYEFARSAAINNKQDMIFNWCTTQVKYDLKSQKCIDLDETQARWLSYSFSIHKIAHLSLEPVSAISEIGVASDGTSEIKSGKSYCKKQRVNNVDGVSCKVIQFKYQRSQNPNTFVSLHLDSKVFGKYKPDVTDIQFSFDGGDYWRNWGSEVSFGSLFTTYNSQISIFMSDNFFKGLIENGISLTESTSFFKFRLRNYNFSSDDPYYFSASSTIKVVPRDYGLSIISTDGSSRPQGSGTIGRDQPPIEFNYKVTLSAPRFADILTAQVKGQQIKAWGRKYCLFESPDRFIQVPVAAELNYTHASGRKVSNRISCGSEVIDMTHANWTAAPWSDRQGANYSTNLNLKFLMNQTVSEKTSAGTDWMGVVTADGLIQVKAQWMGVDR